jgi:adenylate kinase
MIGIVKERLDRDDARPGFVLDGFPRTVAQAAALDGIMNGRDPLVIVDITVPEAELVRRLGTRLICDDCGANATIEDAAAAADSAVLAPAVGAETAAAVAMAAGPGRCRRCGGRLVQRADDNVSVVRERLKVYHRQSAPLVEYYRVRPTFRSVNGAQPPDRVAADLAAAIEAVQP